MLEKDFIERLENNYNMAASMINHYIQRQSDANILNNKIKDIKNIFFNEVGKMLNDYHSEKEKEIEEYENYIYPEDSE